MTATREPTLTLVKPKPKKDDAADRVYAAILQAKATSLLDKTPWSHDTAVSALRAALVKEGFIKHRVNGRDLHFDALATACGYVGPVTKAGGSQIAGALKQIREVEPNVTPEKLSFVAGKVRKKYENSGPNAVAAHWHEFAGDDAKRTAAARNDVYQEPPNWKETLRQMQERNGWDISQINEALTMPWADLSLTLRGEILKANR